MTMPRALLSALTVCAVTATLSAQAKVGNPITGEGLPNPAPNVDPQLGPAARRPKWGTTAGIDIDPIDGNVWAYERCGARHGRRRAGRLRQHTRSIRSSSSIATPARCWRTSARA